MQLRICILTLLLISAIAVSSFALLAPQPEPPDTILLPNKQGEVTFHHLEHQVAINGCTDCHHMGLAAGGCRDCHGVDRLVPRIKQAFHRQCRNCHIKNGAPIGCTDCHAT